MCSSVLRSKRAVQVNIEIMRAFVRLRQMLASHADLARKLDALERKYDAQFKIVFDAIREMMTPPEPNRRRIGFSSPRGLNIRGRHLLTFAFGAAARAAGRSAISTPRCSSAIVTTEIAAVVGKLPSTRPRS